MHGPDGQVGLESNAPVSEVTLWIAEPVLVQVTVVPAATVIVAGEKPKSTIDTWAVAAARGGGSKGSVIGFRAVVGVTVVVLVFTVAAAAVICTVPITAVPTRQPAAKQVIDIRPRKLGPRLMGPLFAVMSTAAVDRSRDTERVEVAFIRDRVTC
jgi:hypothetical protein